MFDYRNTSFQIKEGRPTLGILPIAAIEQHGPHLPAATDLLIMNAISEEVWKRLDGRTFRLPVFPYGTSMGHAAFAGTIWMTADTLYWVVRDVVESLYEHGVTHVVVINNHGGANGTTIVPRGNFVVKTAVRQLNYDYPDRQAIWVQPLAAAQQELATIFSTMSSDYHAGEIETSLMMHLHPDLVQGQAEDFQAQDGPQYMDLVPFEQLSPGGVWGSPSQASAEAGSKSFEAAVQATVNYVDESFAYLDQAKGLSRSGD